MESPTAGWEPGTFRDPNGLGMHAASTAKPRTVKRVSATSRRKTSLKVEAKSSASSGSTLHRPVPISPSRKLGLATGEPGKGAKLSSFV